MHVNFWYTSICIGRFLTCGEICHRRKRPIKQSLASPDANRDWDWDDDDINAIVRKEDRKMSFLVMGSDLKATLVHALMVLLTSLTFFNHV